MSHRLHTARSLVAVALSFVLAASIVSSVFTARADAAAVGMQLHVLWGDVTTAEAERQVRQAADAGAKVVRIDVGWASIEGEGKGQWSSYHLGRLDSVIAAAEREGIKPLLGLADSPCWASSAPDTARQGCVGQWWERDVTHYLPRNPADYADALTFLARRYGTRIAGIEMWNEPNLEYFMRGPNKAERYAELVKVAYAKAKAAAPDVTFVAGSLSESDFKFTQDLYNAGIKGSFDAFSIHPYSHDASPLDPRGQNMTQVSFIKGVPAVHDVMVRNGDDKPLWLTEFGWSTSTVRNAGAWENGVDEAAQALYVRQALDLVRNWSYVPVAIYYGMKDVSDNRADRVSNYGLTHANGSAKPALAAFKAGSVGQTPLPPATGTKSSGAKGTASPEEKVNASAKTVTKTSRGKKKAWVKLAARASRALVVTRARRSVMRVRGRAPGVKRVVLLVRRVTAKGSAVSARRPAGLRLRARVSALGRFNRTFSTARLPRGAYDVTLSGAKPRTSARLVVR